MPGPLLIARKNGRPVRTYGVNQVDVCNMKFTFLCIVVVVSCSVSASGDLEIYPGVKFDLNTEERRSRLENYEVPEIFPEYKDNTWKNIPFDDYPDIERKEPPVYHLTLPERLRQIEEVIDYEKAQLSRHGNHHSKHRYEFGDAYDRLKDKALKNFGLGFPNTQILDDVRMYPQEDDFTFNNDDVDEPDGIQNVFEQPSLEERERMFQENKHVSFNNVRSSDIREELLNSAHHQEHDNAKMASEEEFPTGSFKNVKVVDDPTEFAYAPPDPRFYEKPDTSSKIGDAQQTADKTAGVGSSVSGKFKIKSRSDQNLLEYDDDDAEDLKFHNGNGETSGRSSVDVIAVKPSISDTDSAGVYIIAVVAGISAAATVGLIAVGIGWYNLQKHVKNASDVEYPAYGVTGPNKDISPSGDRRLAQSAQMYHYQHQKQQIIAMERAPPGDRHGSVSEADSDEENEEGDYTVYECPGLAPTGEMEVKNPLFHDDPTPAQTPAVKANEETK